MSIRMAVLAVLIGSVFLFVGGPDEYLARSLQELWNLGHVLLFVLIGSLVLRWKTWHSVSPPVVWLGLLLVVLVLGIGIELAQQSSGRSNLDWLDIGRNLCGVLLALAFGSSSAKSAAEWIRPVQGLAVGLLLLAFVPLGLALLDEYDAHSSFPVLADFSSPLEMERWDGLSNRSRTVVFDGLSNGQMRIELVPARYSGAHMIYFPADWSHYEVLQFDLYLTGDKELRTVFRVHDWLHQTREPTYLHADRYNDATILEPGWNQIRINLNEVRQAPAGRQMDMRNIASFGFFVSYLKQPRVLYLDKVYLN